MKKSIILLLSIFLFSTIIYAQKVQQYEIKSPDGNILLRVNADRELEWSVLHKGELVIAPSAIALILQDGQILGDDIQILSAETDQIDTEFKAINFRKAIVPDVYTSLTLNCENDFGVNFRVYNDAVAYRFFTNKEGEIIIINERANFNFLADHQAFVPYLWNYREGQIFNASFESLYDEIKISQFATDSLSILPMMVDVGGKKVVILEADLESYPGMYLNLNETGLGFRGVYAPYPLETIKPGKGPASINLIPTKRAAFIAKTKGTRTFPWRAVAISEQDKDLLNNDIVQKLASPPRIKDTSWIEPGQAAWDWWHGYDLYGVDFRAGMNTATFIYFIDFAAANDVKYVIMDGGWSVGPDLNNVNPNVDLEKILAHAKSKDVGVILWAAWSGLIDQMEEIFPKYAKMGVKGWKIDYIDRDDQWAVETTYDIAELAAKYHFLVDYHGIFKPTGLQRTWPNVVGYEGVYGLESYKWLDVDAPRYTVTIPFTRNMAGPMDYTSGSMRNAAKADFTARTHAPMSKGTRCNQMAQYVVFEVPLQMLSDSPSTYMKEQECTDFITRIPTVFDKTVPLAGEVAEYVAIARKKNDTWYVGAMTNWTARDMTIDLSFLEAGKYRAIIFQDGINADRQGADYKKVLMDVQSGDNMDIHLAPGGGWAARIEKM